METYGYAGKMLYVDLTTRSIKEEELDLDLARKFIGDFGIGAKLAYDLIKPGTPPLSPENVMILGAGVLSGTSVPGTSRCHLWTRLPQNGVTGVCGGAMGLGGRLKYAGYDMVIIRGRADKPVYLMISDDKVEICDAKGVWGKDTIQTTDEMHRRHGKTCSVLCIGQAGENLVTISLAFIDKAATIGRFGLGAVMGSKNLKAIVADGKRGIRVADRARYSKLVNQVWEGLKNWPILEEFIRLGPFFYDFNGFAMASALKHSGTELVDADYLYERFGTKVYLEKELKYRLACASCPVRCRDILEIKEGDFKGLRVSGHPAWDLAARLDFQNYEELLRFRDAVDRYGIDHFAFAQETEYLLELHERGLVAKEDLEGIELNFESMMELVEKVLNKKGIGAVIADGYDGIVRKFGKECERYRDAMHVKGVTPFVDARMLKVGALQWDAVFNPAGGPSIKGGVVQPGKFDPEQPVERFLSDAKKQIAIPQQAIDRIFNSPYKVNMARLTKHTQDAYAVFSSLGLCINSYVNQFYDMERLAGLYSAATGFETSPEELKQAGDRAFTMFKVLNVREGFSRKDDNFPSRWFEPLMVKGEKVRLKDYFETRVLTADDVEQLKDDYYDERGWEIERGIPTSQTLTELGLEEVVEDFQKLGIF